MTSLRVYVLQIAMYDELSASNATGSFQNQCSVASQMDYSPDEASSSGTRVTNLLRKRDMTGLLAEDLKEEAKARRLQNSNQNFS